MKKRSQALQILLMLLDARGMWVNGRKMKHFTQYHARIFELQEQGYNIEASTFFDEFGFKSYRLVKDEITKSLLKRNKVVVS